MWTSVNILVIILLCVRPNAITVVCMIRVICCQ